MNVSRITVSSAGRTSGRATLHSTPELAGAVDPGRLEQLLGQLQEVLPEDDHRRRVDEERQDHPEVAVGQAEVAGDHDVQRDHQELERHHLHQQREGEDDPRPRQCRIGERVAGQHAEHDGADEHAAREDARVHEPLQQVDALVDRDVVLAA